VTSKAEARALCNQERFLTECAEIGKSRKLYKEPERIKQVDVLLGELRGKAVDELKQCTDAICVADAAHRLAESLTKKDPEVARALDLVTEKVEQKRAIIEAAGELGVDAARCRDMNPETALVDVLRGCARLAKHERVSVYLPEKAKKAAEFTEGTTSLKESLRRGEIQCGDNTTEGCGQYCLNSSDAARPQKTIPAVCREIAARFFGPEGVKHLEQAYTQVKQTSEYYAKKAENLVFTTHEGRTLTEPVEIGRYLEGEGRKGNVEAVEKGLDIMVANGFASPDDKTFALDMVRKVKEQGRPMDFDACSEKPESCREFIPEERRGEFEAYREMEKIMGETLGFDRRECARASGQSDIGRRCLQGAKAALGHMEELATRYPEISPAVREMRGHIRRGEEFEKRKTEIEQEFQRGEGLPCGSIGECESFCADPAHGPECIAFGAKHRIFEGEEAVERFQAFHQTLQGPQGVPPGVIPVSFPRVGPYPGFQPPGQSEALPPGQMPGFTAPGPGFNQPPGYFPGEGSSASGAGQGYGFGPAGGPGPECLRAIESGDFVRAKEVCATYNVQSFPPRQREEGRVEPTHSPEPAVRKGMCPSLPTVNSCPEGQQKTVRFQSPECGTYYACVPEKGEKRPEDPLPYGKPQGEPYHYEGPDIGPYKPPQGTLPYVKPPQEGYRPTEDSTSAPTIYTPQERYIPLEKPFPEPQSAPIPETPVQERFVAPSPPPTSRGPRSSFFANVLHNFFWMFQ
ncbi:MAG: hypothetical protein Q8R13_02090, partial [bacterium]|nr:hypothetical protein [bacterium]